ncbi:hypothetical protein F1D05_30920 [Kribbella qitaiheensis]|uniref:Uncharacterized protein n=1 Tax=Kribbella qitaiheensis TaxID=1544730 RepID=A0A7G6X5L4_9ACTN|nr:DUF6182 family protein [Kribbella qitaiheensis]QNE21529.1 hypothetical protein F1D05_30920 [Kribbella qitaiheensis]
MSAKSKPLPARGEPGGPLERQIILRKISQRRCDRARRGLPAATPIEWLGWEPRRPPAAMPGASALSVMAVVGDVDCEGFIAGLLEFVHTVPLEDRDSWWRNLTKTLFFRGSPTEHGAIAWLGPGTAEQFADLGLERFHETLKLPDELELYVPGGPPTGRRMSLRVATKEVTGRAYLTHLQHVLSEAYLRSFLRPGDRLEVRHEDNLDPVEEIPAGNRDFEARIASDPRSPGCLRLYANLTVVPALHGAP